MDENLSISDVLSCDPMHVIREKRFCPPGSWKVPVSYPYGGYSERSPFQEKQVYVRFILYRDSMFVEPYRYRQIRFRYFCFSCSCCEGGKESLFWSSWSFYRGLHENLPSSVQQQEMAEHVRQHEVMLRWAKGVMDGTLRG